MSPFEHWLHSFGCDIEGGGCDCAGVAREGKRWKLEAGQVAPLLLSSGPGPGLASGPGPSLATGPGLCAPGPGLPVQFSISQSIHVSSQTS